jgi:hypothetical protein
MIWGKIHPQVFQDASLCFFLGVVGLGLLLGLLQEGQLEDRRGKQDGQDQQQVSRVYDSGEKTGQTAPDKASEGHGHDQEGGVLLELE